MADNTSMHKDAVRNFWACTLTPCSSNWIFGLLRLVFLSLPCVINKGGYTHSNEDDSDDDGLLQVGALDCNSVSLGQK